MRCTARASAECRSNALTASLCELICRDFLSRPQELQGRLTEAILECVLLAGSSFGRCARAWTRVGLCELGCMSMMRVTA